MNFIIAFFIWFFLLIFFAYSFSSTELNIPIYLTIDAANIGQDGGLKNSNKSLKKTNKSESEFAQEKSYQENLSNKSKHSHDSDLQNDKDEQQILFRQLPEIPEDLRQEAFKSEAIARFYIDKNGVVIKVDLIKPCNNPKLNYLLLKSLKKWRFSKAEFKGGKEINVQDVKVSFEVN